MGKLETTLQDQKSEWWWEIENRCLGQVLKDLNYTKEPKYFPINSGSHWSFHRACEFYKDHPGYKSRWWIWGIDTGKAAGKGTCIRTVAWGNRPYPSCEDPMHWLFPSPFAPQFIYFMPYLRGWLIVKLISNNLISSQELMANTGLMHNLPKICIWSKSFNCLWFKGGKRKKKISRYWW